MALRTELNLGYACNNNCVFCGEGRTRAQFMKSGRKLTTDDILKTIMDFRRAGSEHLTFLGGEPTIRKDFVEIVTFARTIGFKKLLMTTNGRMLANKSYAKQVVDAGLNDIVLSIHGDTAEIHDGLTRSAGSFDQTMQAADNLAALGRQFSTCTVIVQHNEAALPRLVERLAAFRTRRMLLTFPIIHGNAVENFDHVASRLKQAGPHVIAAIETARTHGRMVTVGHVPFCAIPGYEGYADILYWSERLKRVVQKYLGRDVQPDGHIVDFHGTNKSKLPICRDCRHAVLCEGVDHMYLARAGGDEFLERPPGFDGPAVTDPETLKARTHFHDAIDYPEETNAAVEI